jgi:hypothetical protein
VLLVDTNEPILIGYSLLPIVQKRWELSHPFTKEKKVYLGEFFILLILYYMTNGGKSNYGYEILFSRKIFRRGSARLL